MVLFSDAAILLQWYNKYKLMGPIRKANINIKLNAASNIRVQKKKLERETETPNKSRKCNPKRRNRMLGGLYYYHILMRDSHNKNSNNHNNGSSNSSSNHHNKIYLKLEDDKELSIQWSGFKSKLSDRSGGKKSRICWTMKHNASSMNACSVYDVFFFGAACVCIVG